MKVYFVRHGQSLLTENRHQLPETPLSNLGLKQTAAIAQRFTHIPIDLILTSSYARALQTAQAIKKIKSVPLIQSDLFIERKMPSLFLGKLVDDPEITSTLQEMREHFYEPGWHYADEENFADLLSRTQAAFNLILSQQRDTNVVVTHGYFLTVMIFYMLFGETVNKRAFKSFREHTANSNAGLTLCEYKDEKWKLLTWNDYAHFGEE